MEVSRGSGNSAERCQLHRVAGTFSVSLRPALFCYLFRSHPLFFSLLSLSPHDILQVIAGSKLWHFVVDDADVATEFLKRQSRRRLGGEVNFISIAELVSDPSKKQPVDEAWIARKAPEFKDRAKPALSLIQRNTEGVQVRRFYLSLKWRLRI